MNFVIHCNITNTVLWFLLGSQTEATKGGIFNQILDGFTTVLLSNVLLNGVLLTVLLTGSW